MELSPALRALLDKNAFGHVITMNRDGSPQVTLVWVTVHDGKPSFNTNSTRQKGRNLARDQRIMMSVQNPDDLREYALIEGTAIVSTDGARDQVLQLAEKYTGNAQYNFQPDEQRIIVDIDISRVTGRGPWVS